MSDIVAPDELPSWHIECKGTKNPELTQSTLGKWLKQIDTDCPSNLVPVIIHSANKYEYIAIIPLDTWKKICPNYVWGYFLWAEETITPTKEFIKKDRQDAIEASLGLMSNPVGVIAHKVNYKEINTVVIILKASVWLQVAKTYEKQVVASKFAAVKELN